MDSRERLLRSRVRAALNEERDAGRDYREIARLARELGYHSVADAFEDAAMDERRHKSEFGGVLEELGTTLGRGLTMRDL